MTALFQTVHTHHSDSPGSSRTLLTASGYEVNGMTSGYGDYFTEIRHPGKDRYTPGRIAARIEWAESQQTFEKAWNRRRPRLPADVHAAICDLFPFLVPQDSA